MNTSYKLLIFKFQKKYKSEAKLCADVTNLLFQCSPTKQKNSHQLLPVETIDVCYLRKQ